MFVRRFLLALLLSAPSAHAGGLDLHLVPREADWVLHVDLAALSRSTLLQSMHERGIRMENEFNLDHIATQFGVDPLKELNSLTLFGLSDAAGGIACVVDGSAKLESAWMRLAEQASRSRIAGRDALSVGRGSDARYMVLLPRGVGMTPLVVVATTSVALERACAVLAGEAPNLAAEDSEGLLQVRPSDGALIYAVNLPGAPLGSTKQRTVFLERGMQLLSEFANVNAASKKNFARGVRGLQFELSETRGEFSMSLALEVDSASTAKELESTLAQSLAPWSSPQVPANLKEPLARLMVGLKIAPVAARLELSYRCASRSFVADILQVEQAGK
jgi:hypothetical protein